MGEKIVNADLSLTISYGILNDPEIQRFIEKVKSRYANEMVKRHIWSSCFNDNIIVKL